MSGDAVEPSTAIAAYIAESFLSEPLAACDRFQTGLRNWVYDVTALNSGRRIVVRMCHPNHRQELRSGIVWLKRLAGLGVPVPEILASDLDGRQPFTILDRLPGTDIGNVLPNMSADQVREAAEAVAEMQLRARQLPPAQGFGYALDYEAPLHESWLGMLRAEIEDSRQLIVRAGAVSADRADQVSELLDRQAGLLDGVEPLAFLDDATTKNVIVDAGRVIGLVDLDHVAFGDPLWAVALTRMSLLGARNPTDFADRQIDLVSSSEHRQQRIELYTALHCLGFLAELGQKFNQAEAPPIDAELQQHLETVLEYTGDILR